jgi:uncharacterized protein YbjT (DUF2867 family)
MIAVFGATGTLGQELVPRLVANGQRVRAIARHVPADAPAPSGPGVEWMAADVRDPRSLEAALLGVDTVVSAVAGFGRPDALGSRVVDRDGNIALIEAARRAGTSTFVMISINDAGPEHPIELLRDKWAAEEALRASDLSWTIIRPTASLESWLGIVGRPLVQTGTTRIFGTGRNPINFVSTVDVAGFVELAIADPGLRGTAIEVPGPENLTLDDLARLVESACGRTGRLQHAPRLMLRFLRLATRVPKPVLSALIGAALVMDTRDMTVDGPAIRAAFPSVPMTPPVDVARRMFAAASGPVAQGIPSEAPS